jgi:hypothetical protein
MNQREFDADLYTKFDDTGFLMKFPEDSVGYLDNPIRKLFEQDIDLAVEDGD